MKVYIAGSILLGFVSMVGIFVVPGFVFTQETQVASREPTTCEFMLPVAEAQINEHLQRRGSDDRITHAWSERAVPVRPEWLPQGLDMCSVPVRMAKSEELKLHYVGEPVITEGRRQYVVSPDLDDTGMARLRRRFAENLHPCERHVGDAADTVVASPFYGGMGLGIVHMGEPVEADPRPASLGAGAYLCSAPVLTNRGTRRVMHFRLDPLPELGEGRFGVGAGLGEEARAILEAR